MILLITSLIILVVTGLASTWLSARGDRYANFIGASGAVIAFFLSVIPAAMSLYSGRAEQAAFSWQLPFAQFYISIDPLSSFFMISMLILCAAGAVYGTKYMGGRFASGRICPTWLWYNLLEAGMITVLVSNNAIMFLFSWEIMSIASFFLVMSDHCKESVRSAGWTYLIATHIGTFFLIALFTVMSVHSGSFDFETGMKYPALSASMIFIFAIIGFGIKAGFMPFHIWLPEAHPAAPSHVSAVMSGAMIKMGIYGILRIISLQSHMELWWGVTLLSIGIISGILGVVLALAQHNLKRMLAYSSVENIGIISIGIGLGVIGVSTGNQSVAVLGFGGGLLHVLNHGFFKGMLFMSAGSVYHATETLEIDRLGGLIKKMPFSGFSFIIGSASISGLPPFNGFISEFLIYASALNLMISNTSLGITASVASILSLALIGGLALACFSKAVGIVFLGEPRDEKLQKTHESPKQMILPIIVLSGGCIVIPYLAPVIMHMMSNIMAILPDTDCMASVLIADQYAYIVLCMSIIFIVLIIIIIVLYFLRKKAFEAKSVEYSPTWDCGYCKPSPRMQYTGSSYSRPLLLFFNIFILPVLNVKVPGRKFFPGKSFFETRVPDIFNRFVFEKVFIFIRGLSDKLKWIQLGSVQIYILYITLTLLVLIVIKMATI